MLEMVATDPVTTPAPRFAVVVPVKPPAVGKSRLGGAGGDGGDGVDDESRRRLAAAFALDTVAAAVAAGRVGAVLVVTDDAGFSTALARLGAHAIPDGVSLDLNATLRQGAAEAGRRWPDLVPVALCADLPALAPADLDEALGEAAGSIAAGLTAYVADTEGTGTTLYAAPTAGFDPHFGIGSAAVHRARGAVPVAAAVPTLRRDVDDPADLTEARGLGVGRHTAGLDAP